MPYLKWVRNVTGPNQDAQEAFEVVINILVQEYGGRLFPQDFSVKSLYA